MNRKNKLSVLRLIGLVVAITVLFLMRYPRRLVQALGWIKQQGTPSACLH